MIGRTRQRLAEMLTKELGARVAPDDFAPVTGYWRSSPYADCMRWDGFVTIEGVPRSIGSWDTMKDCVRHGFTISRETPGHGPRLEANIMVYANAPPRKAT